MTTYPKNPLARGRRMRPTRKHRIAVWENMLGTVFAMDDAGVVRYFDYDWDAAVAHAGVDEPDRDPRRWRAERTDGQYDLPTRGQWVLFVLRKEED